MQMIGEYASVIFPCTIKPRRRYLLLALARPGSPGRSVVKRLCCVFAVRLQDVRGSDSVAELHEPDARDPHGRGTGFGS